MGQDESRIQSESSKKSFARQGSLVYRSSHQRSQSMVQNPGAYSPSPAPAPTFPPAYSIQDPSPTRTTNSFINPSLTVNTQVQQPFPQPAVDATRRRSAQPLPQVPASSINSHRRAATSVTSGSSTNQFPNASRSHGGRTPNPPPPVNATAGGGYSLQAAAPAAVNRRASTEDPLLQLVKYDTVIIVDDSSSMAGRLWLEAEQALAGVASIAAKYDSDGIDICFLNSQETGKGVTAEDVQRLFARIDPDGITPTGEKLEILLLDYLLRLEQAKAEQDAGHPEAMQQIKPVNFVVITDGAPTDDPETVIMTAARRLDQGRFPISQVGIQFVQIGNDPAATEALRELDDDLAGKYGIRDIVDTTPYSGHRLDSQTLTKILLGGINRRVDRRGAV